MSIPVDYEILRVIWWLFLGVLLIGFAIMDGFDLGVATLLPFVARTGSHITPGRLVRDTSGNAAGPCPGEGDGGVGCQSCSFSFKTLCRFMKKAAGQNRRSARPKCPSVYQLANECAR